MLYENYVIDRVEPKKTKDGYLVASSRVARTGIQKYRGSEMGKPSIDIVRVYRPADEVFSKASLTSFAHKPITLDHPPDPVNADTWKDRAVGGIGEDILRDGECVRVPMVLMDSSAVRAIEDGKRELSMGYTCDIDWTPGTTADGEEYDAIQRNIRINHLAIVKNARGGSLLAFGDEDDSLEGPWVVVTVDEANNKNRNPDGTFATKGTGDLTEGEGGSSSRPEGPQEMIWSKGGWKPTGNKMPEEEIARGEKANVPAKVPEKSEAEKAAAPKPPSHEIQYPAFRQSTRINPTTSWFESKKEAQEFIKNEQRKWKSAKAIRHLHVETYPARGIRKFLGLGGKQKQHERYEVRAGRDGLDGQNVGDYYVDAASVQDEKNCPHCGYELQPGEDECPECGYELDDSQGEMEMKTITIDSLPCEMSDTAALVVQKHVSALEKQAKDAKDEFKKKEEEYEEEKKKRATDEATYKTQLATKDAEIATLTKQRDDAKVTPQQLDAMAAERQAVVDKARAVLGDKLVIDGKTVGEIRRQVVDASMGDTAKGWNDDQITASFGTLTKDAAIGVGNGVNDIARSFTQQTVGDARDAAYKAYDASLTNAWRGGKAA